MITAEDFLLNKVRGIVYKQPNHKQVEEWLIEFAKMHITEALKKAYFNHKINTINGHNQPIIELDEDSILKAYPLDNVV